MLSGPIVVITNLLDNEETCDQWKEDLPLDDHYEVDYLRDNVTNFIQTITPGILD